MGAIANPGPAAAKLTKQGTYTQTYSPATRTQAEEALATNLSLTLVSEIVPILNQQNKAINELKKLSNGIVDDLQALELVG